MAGCGNWQECTAGSPDIGVSQSYFANSSLQKWDVMAGWGNWQEHNAGLPSNETKWGGKEAAGGAMCRILALPLPQPF